METRKLNAVVASPLQKLVVTEAEAKKVRELLRALPSFEELCENFPSFSKAIKALPETKLLLRSNPILRTFGLDAICRAKGLPDGTYDYLV